MDKQPKVRTGSGLAMQTYAEHKNRVATNGTPVESKTISMDANRPAPQGSGEEYLRVGLDLFRMLGTRKQLVVAK